MPLQIRRGTQQDRTDLVSANVPLAAGEPLFTTDSGNLYLGDGTTPGGVHINATNLANYIGQIGEIENGGGTFPFIDLSAGAASINLNGQVASNVTPNFNDLFDLGSSSFRYKNIYLTAGNRLTPNSGGIHLGNARIVANGSTIDLPAGSTIGGVSVEGVVAGGDYHINIIGPDALPEPLTIVDSLNSIVSADQGLFNSIEGNITVSDNISSDGQLLTIGNKNPNLSLKIKRFLPITENHTEYVGISDANYSIGDHSYLSRGTTSSPTAVLPDDRLCSTLAFGHDGSNYLLSSGILHYVDAAGTVSTGSVPGSVSIFTTSDGNPLNTKGINIDSRGYVSINNFGNQPKATLDVNGFAKLAVLTAEPTSPENGMIAIADGSIWNPAGTGKSVMVIYLGGGWRVAATAP